MDMFAINRVGPAHDYGYAVTCLLTQRELGRFDTHRQAEAFVEGCKAGGGFGAVELIIDLKALLEHYLSGKPDNWDNTTKTQAMVTLRKAKAFLDTP
jgi:hypothetical protein